MANIKDVAKLAEVSIMTVSRVINNKGYVKEETRQKINKAIKKLNYYPNSMGRNLNTNSVKIIAVMAPLINGLVENEPYYVRIISGIESVLSEYNYDILLSTQRVKHTEQSDSFDFCRPYLERKVDGIIILPGSYKISQRDYKIIEKNRIPACIINDQPEQKVLDAVDSDSYKGFRILLETVYNLGHRDLAFGGLDIYNNNISQRYICYKDFLKEKNLLLREDWVFKYPHITESGNKIINDYIQLEEKPSVILFSTDNYASGALEETKKRGIKIPQDLSITGYDGSPITKHMSPTLMTVKQPLAEMGMKAAEVIMERIKNPNSPFKVYMLETTQCNGESIIAKEKTQK